MSNRSYDVAFHLLAWKFVKRLGKAETCERFGDAMSNGSHHNHLPYVSLEIRERRKGIYFEGKDMYCHRSKMWELFCFIYIPLSTISKWVSGVCWYVQVNERDFHIAVLAIEVFRCFTLSISSSFSAGVLTIWWLPLSELSASQCASYHADFTQSI